MDQLLLDYLAQHGIILASPRFVKLQSGVITVRASLAELDTIEALLVRMRDEE